MQVPLPVRAPSFAAPSFYLTSRQRLHPGVILIAIVAAVSALASVVFAMGHTRPARLAPDGPGSASSASATAGGAPPDDDKDDPSQIDTIVLGDPADAPVPARKGDHVSPVHPTILVRLPRYGDQVGLIPDTPAGHLLYGWLAAFNQASYTALATVLPSAAPANGASAQMELRHQTGGFSLVSAKEVQPGVLVFRMHDQTPTATEVLGTLQVDANATPAAIASFSLRAVSQTGKDPTPEAAPSLGASKN
jgi:hypothetical protein